MPYEMYREEGKFCVRNSESGESKGCSETRKMAIRHMSALYRAEGKSKKEADLLIKAAVDKFVLKEAEEEIAEPEVEMESKGYYDAYDSTYMPTFGATSYSQVMEMEDALESQHEAEKLINMWPGLAFNIISSSEIEDKKSAIVGLANELSSLIVDEAKSSHDEKDKGISHEDIDKESEEESLINKVFNAVKEKLSDLIPKKQTSSLMVWKEVDGSWRWIARYSNTFRDRDNPPEIVSSKSHRRFVDLVEKGLAPYPELWLWHVPEWKVGVADWIAYDEVKEGVGFSMASGHFFPWAEQVAEWLDSQDNILVSHGMPATKIARDGNDNSVIIEHETREISPLPAEFAANQITTFYVLNTKEVEEENMAIPQEKRKILTEKYGLDVSVLDKIEQINSKDAGKALEEGIETKENEAASTETTTEETTSSEQTSSETSESEGESAYPTRAELVEVLKPLMESIGVLSAALEGMQKEIGDLKESKEVAVQKTIASTPQASLMAMLTGRAVGDPAASVGSGDLANSKPKETPVLGNDKLGINFLDKMLVSKQ